MFEELGWRQGCSVQWATRDCVWRLLGAGEGVISQVLPDRRLFCVSSVAIPSGGLKWDLTASHTNPVLEAGPTCPCSPEPCPTTRLLQPVEATYSATRLYLPECCCHHHVHHHGHCSHHSSASSYSCTTAPHPVSRYASSPAL